MSKKTTTGPKTKHKIKPIRPEYIFSGEYSRDMWNTINSAKTVTDLRFALYGVCCRLQEFESRVKKKP